MKTKEQLLEIRAALKCIAPDMRASDALLLGVPDIDPLGSLIAEAVNTTEPGKARTDALKAIRWQFRGPNGEYVGLDGGTNCAFVPQSNAQVFDGRDNQEAKRRFWQAQMRVTLTIEVIR
jgi:hypothetical protein